MDNEKFKLSFQIQLTTWPQTFQDGKNILEIANLHPERSRLLSACSCILMATALDQAVWAKLVCFINDAENPKELPERYAGLLDAEGTFKQRIDAIPEILTEGRLQLNKEASHVKSLYQLIRLRNGLVHIRDGMKEGLIEVTTEDFNKGPIKIEPPLYPWDAVNLKDARAFQDAVSMYLQDVIDTEEIKPGPIVKNASQ